MPTVNQPVPNVTYKSISPAQIASVLLARKRWPGYLSQLDISPDVEAAVNAMSTAPQSGNGPAMPAKIPDNIPDDIAVAALADGNNSLPILLTFNQQQNDMRRKMSYPRTFQAYPRNVRALGKFPVITGSLNALNAFGAFADGETDVQADAGLSPQDVIDANTPASDPGGTDLTNVDPSSPQWDTLFANVPDQGTLAAEGVPGAIANPTTTTATPATAGGVSFGSGLLASLPSLLTAGLGITNAVTGRPATPVAGVAAKPATTSMNSILLLGGLAVAAYFFLNSSKSGGSRRRR